MKWVTPGWSEARAALALLQAVVRLIQGHLVDEVQQRETVLL